MIYEKFNNEKRFYFHHDINIANTGELIIKPHYHNLFEIYYITAGNCTYFIDNNTYQLEPGDVILVPDGIIHNTKYQNSVHSRMLIHCSRSLIPPSVQQILPPSLHLYRNPDTADEIRDIFHKIRKEYSVNDSLSEDSLCCYTNMLFLLMAKNINTRAKIDVGNKYIEQAVSFIQKHFANNISLNEVAEMCCVTPEHFSRMFKKETSFSFCEYINLLRMQKARTLITQNSGLSVAEISDQCGFNDSNYFSLKFKKMYGISPKKLQSLNKN